MERAVLHDPLGAVKGEPTVRYSPIRAVMTVDRVALTTLRVLQEKGNIVLPPSLAGNSTFFRANYAYCG
jgi:hypothetical protein